MRFAFASIFALATVVALAACPPNTPPSPPPSPPTPVYAPPDTGAPPTPVALIDAAPSAGAPGAACTAPTDCDSGACEGQGCGPDAPGRCVDKKRMCTMDLESYCGCDGATFQSSGSCPGRRYNHRGACTQQSGPPAPPAKHLAGEECLTGDDCANGVCEGKGCGDAHPGHCAPDKRRCARNRVPFCGCDGKTFTTSSTCQGQRYEHSGKC